MTDVDESKARSGSDAALKQRLAEVERALLVHLPYVTPARNADDDAWLYAYAQVVRDELRRRALAAQRPEPLQSKGA
jgi:hypothetical protein